MALGTIIGGPIGDRIGRKRVIWVSILGVAPIAMLIPYVGSGRNRRAERAGGHGPGLGLSGDHRLCAGPDAAKVGLVAGLFFGLAFGLGGLGAAAIGLIADATSIEYVFWLCSFLPLIGVLAVFLPDVKRV